MISLCQRRQTKKSRLSFRQTALWLSIHYSMDLRLCNCILFGISIYIWLYIN
nr:MAG TPA: hypothetical protein [Caudoviricetes sp.]